MTVKPLRVLLQTTIPATSDDWSIERFTLLRSLLENTTLADGQAAFEVHARDRGDASRPDPVLSRLQMSNFDEMWLFGVDGGNGLFDEDCDGIARFQREGRGVLVTRDHMDLGSSVRLIPELGKAHHFHSFSQDPDPSRRRRDDIATPAISWPNYHSGANGDFQPIEIVGEPHPVLFDPREDCGFISNLPSHPHEGSVDAPACSARARVIARGRSIVTGAKFNIAVAFEGSRDLGPSLCQSTFHHFVDLNWDPSRGCPSFVLEPPGQGLRRSTRARSHVRRYVTNLALWLGGRDPTRQALVHPVDGPLA